MSSIIPSTNVKFIDIRNAYTNAELTPAVAATNIKLANFRGALFTDGTNVPQVGGLGDTTLSTADFIGKTFMGPGTPEFTTTQFCSGYGVGYNKIAINHREDGEGEMTAAWIKNIAAYFGTTPDTQSLAYWQTKIGDGTWAVQQNFGSWISGTSTDFATVLTQCAQNTTTCLDPPFPAETNYLYFSTDPDFTGDNGTYTITWKALSCPATGGGPPCPPVGYEFVSANNMYVTGNGGNITPPSFSIHCWDSYPPPLPDPQNAWLNDIIAAYGTAANPPQDVDGAKAYWREKIYNEWEMKAGGQDGFPPGSWSTSATWIKLKAPTALPEGPWSGWWGFDSDPPPALGFMATTSYLTIRWRYTGPN